MSGWWWAIPVAAVLVVVGLYLSSTAGRLDRLHRRVDQSRKSLDAALARRVSVVNELVSARVFDPTTVMLLGDAAYGASEVTERDPVTRGLAESELTRALAAAFEDPEDVAELASLPDGGELIADLESACRRVEMSRRFLNDGVRACRAVRSQRFVRYFRLAGHTPWPESFEMDDLPPAGFGVR